MDRILNTLKSKAGIGLIEILATMVLFIFGFLAVNMVQVSNIQTVENMNARAYAAQLGDYIADSLEASGINIVPIGRDSLTRVQTFRSGDRDLTREFTVVVDTKESMIKLEETLFGEPIERVYSKTSNIEVRWNISNTPHSIKVVAEVQ
jgi:hypothetical protein